MDACSFIVAVLYFSSLFICRNDAQEQPRVTLNDGSVILGQTDDYSIDHLNIHTKIDTFYGIPYAEPPVGTLRFRPPVRKGPLSEPLEANKVGNACMQVNSTESDNPILITADTFSEDCLYLDVLVPNPLPEDAPVLVNIHGGGFVVGSGSFTMLTLKPLVAFGKYVVVSMNYRLGAFGFLTTGDSGISGNFGLLDQQMSLEWVRDNIAAFGGNPNRVTIIGISAGGASVGFQLLSPGSKGLFQNAIMESGSPTDGWLVHNPPEQSLKIARATAKIGGCPEDETMETESLLACLQKIPAEDILTNEAKLTQEVPLLSFLPYPPSVDGIFVPKAPAEILEAGEVNPANLIACTNADEGTLFLFLNYPDKDNKPIVNLTSYQQILTMYTGVADPTVADIIRTIFTEDNAEFSQKEEQFFTPLTKYISDAMMVCGQNKFALDYAAAGNDVYKFFYTHTASNNIFNITWGGAAHGDEMIFTYGGPFEPDIEDTVTDVERAMVVQTMTYYKQFIHTGNPNSDETDSGPYPTWPKLTPETKEYKELAPDFENKQYLREKQCYFIEKVFPKLRDLVLNAAKAVNEDEGKKWTEDGQCDGDDCH